MTAWNGRVVTRARAEWARRLDAAGGLPCSKCRKPVTTQHRWQVDHLVPRALGGDLTDPANQWPAHARCNEAAGTRLAQQLRESRRISEPVGAMSSERSRGIRGI